MKLNPLLFFQSSQADSYEIDKNIKPHIYNLKLSQEDKIKVYHGNTGQPYVHKQKSTAYHPHKLLKYNRQTVRNNKTPIKQ